MLHRIVAVGAVITVSASLICAEAQPIFSDQHDALHGLTGVYVMGADIDRESAGGVYTKQAILAGVELQLFNAGITVLSEEDWLFDDGAPVLYVDVRTKSAEDRTLVYLTRLEVLHLVVPVSDPSASGYAVIWSADDFGVMGRADEAGIREIVESLTEQLITDYTLANSHE